MRVTDSRDNSGPGFLALQDHSARNQDLEDRALIAAVRIVGRKERGTDLGHFVHERGSGGDVIGASLWPRSSRSISAWSWVWPVRTGATARTVSTPPVGPRDVRAGDPVPDQPGGNRPPRVPGGNPVGDVARAGAGGGGGGSPAGGDSFFVGTPFGVFGGERSKDTSENIEPVRVQPTFDTPQSWDLRFASELITLPAGYPEMPRLWHGLTVPGTDEKKQSLQFHPTDPRIPLVHDDGRPEAGALACDLDAASAPHLARHARLHTHMRVILTPPRANGRNVVAWNLAPTGRSDSQGGYLFDLDDGGRRGPTTPRGDPNRRPTPITPSSLPPTRTPLDRPGGSTPLAPNLVNRPRQRPAPNRQGPFRPNRGVDRGSAGSPVVTMVSYRHGGPFHPGRAVGDPHQIGVDGDRHPVNPVHLATTAFWIDPGVPRFDYPMLFERDFEEGDDLDFPVRVHLGPDGRWWRWWTTATEETEEPPPNRPPTPGDPGDGDDPPPPPPSPPGEPRPPITPGSDPGSPTSGGDDDDIPPPPFGPVTPGRPGTGGGGTGGGQLFPGTDPERSPFPPFGPLPQRNRQSGSWIQASAVQRSGSLEAHKVSHTRRWREMQTSSISFRAPRWQTSAPNMVHSPQTRQIMDDESRVAPVVLRTETFAKQVSGGRPVYTQPPGSSRYQGGTAAGGLWFMPPEVGGEDRDDALAPSGRSISTSVLGIGAGVRLGFGAPHIDTGHIVNGHWLKDDGGDLVVEKLNASGSPTEAFRFTTEGAMIFEDIGGDPASPASGFVALYVKSGNFHQKDSGGTVTSLV